MNEITFDGLSAVADTLKNVEYNRQRLNPHPKDAFYVHLSDIRMFLDSYSHETFGTVLDYGCGGSPYRPLFKADNYLRGDYVDCGDLDFLIGPDGKVPLSDNSCDAVVSTQVLEHVLSPHTYLSEALRVLRPGGKLVLTTHGVWEDHGCPYDFRRWTYDGLRRDIEEVGFEVNRAARLTTGSRAILFLLSQTMEGLGGIHRNLSGRAVRLLHSNLGLRQFRHRWMDHRLANNRVVFEKQQGHGFYLGLGLEGRKPQCEPTGAIPLPEKPTPLG
jgi:SAM-dependent methyltransferase